MKILRVVAALVIVGGFLAATSARASAATSPVTITSATYVPYDNNNGAFGYTHLTLPVTVPGGAFSIAFDVKLTLRGQPFPGAQMSHSVCTSNADASAFHCEQPFSAPSDQVDLYVPQRGMQEAIWTHPTADVVVTVTVPSTGDTVTGYVYVRPESDLEITGLHLTGDSLTFTYFSHGPTGSARTSIVISGYKSQPKPEWPGVCDFGGSAITCILEAKPNLDNWDGAWVIPLPAGQVGCAYTVKATGLYDDPYPANNAQSVHQANLGCAAPPAPSSTHSSGGSGSKPSASATPSPNPSASPSATAGPTPDIDYTPSETPPTSITAAAPPVPHNDSSGIGPIVGGVTAVGVVLIGGAGWWWYRRRPTGRGSDQMVHGGEPEPRQNESHT